MYFKDLISKISIDSTNQKNRKIQERFIQRMRESKKRNKVSKEFVKELFF